jgi:hypothetical protein
MRPHIKRQIERMLSEFLREIGVLVLVFAPLESLVTSGALTTTAVVATLSVVLPCLIFGAYLGLEDR